MEEFISPHLFSDWLKQRRKALDLTQDELAKRVGCSLGALRKIESGDRRPSKQLAGLLAKALEISNEDQETFIRVARGDINLERLQKPTLVSLALSPDITNQQQTQRDPLEHTSAILPSTKNRIPLQITPLIGRDAEFTAMGRLFNDPQCRLLTLTGMGGIGKTRLAIEFALKIQADFPGGVFYIALSSVNSPKKIIPAIADVIDFRFSGPSTLKDQLFNYISSQIHQKALFVFDNLEHLLNQSLPEDNKPGVVELISEILHGFPNVKILTTSRERLNMRGEWTYELYGLSVPPTNYVGRLEEYDSIELFLRSAQRIRSDFQISEEERKFLVQISQLVQGVPLAIELAAAWVGILSCEEIAQEIQANMDFLTTSFRDIPERHRSIRATFDHSWKLLAEEECWVLCQLAVFQGGFDRNAARQIAGATLSNLASLISKSLLRHNENGRYDLHEVIRQYAISHLDENPRSLDPHNRHCKYYLSLVKDCGKLLKSNSQQEAILQITGEIDNIRTAWVWANDYGNFDQIGEAVRGFGWYYEITGLYREGIEQLDLLINSMKFKPQDTQWCKIMGTTLIHRGLLHFRIGEFEIARKYYEESILLLRPIGEQKLLADSLAFLGTILHLQGEYERARLYLEESLNFARWSNEKWFEAWAVFNLGYLDSLMGHFSEGYEQMLNGLAMWRVIGDPQSIALGLNFLIPTLIKLSHFDEAKSFLHESIAMCEQSKNRWGMGTAYRFLGLVYIASGQPTEAQSFIMKSLEIFGEFAVGWDIARSISYLGDAAKIAGNYHEARKIYKEALESAIQAQAIPIALDALIGLGEIKAQFGEIEIALLFFYFISHHPASDSEAKSRAKQLSAELEPNLHSKQIMKAQSLATELSFERIGKIALESN